MPYDPKRCLLLCIALAVASSSAYAQSPVLLDMPSKKWRICNPFTTEPVTAALFDEARRTYDIDTLIRVKKDGRFGFYTSTGRVVLPTTFEDVFDDWQTGIREGFVGVLQAGKRGLFSVQTGRRVLASEYEYLGCIYPDLLVGRKKGDDFLTFFDEKGVKLFETPGFNAYPGFDQHTVEVLDEARKRRFIDKQGRPVFSAQFKDARWTDGATIAVVRFSAAGSVEGSALLNTAGDTLMGMQPFNLTPVGQGRFLARRLQNQEMALLDRQGHYLLSMREYWLVKQGVNDPNGVIYAQKQGFANGHQLYDAAGTLLFDNCRLTSVPFERVRVYKQPAYHPQQYFQLELMGKPNSSGFFASDGRMIAPMAFQGFKYYSDEHPVIAFGNHPTQLDEQVCQVFDLKTGAKLFLEDYQEMHFTTRPTHFWAKKGGRWGVLAMGKSMAARFEFDKIKPLPFDFMAAQRAGSWYFFNSEGVQKSSEKFDDILPPTWEQFDQYHKRGLGTGKLLAIGIKRAKPDGAWYGISVSGEIVYFSNSIADQATPVDLETPPEMYDQEVAPEIESTPRPANTDWSESNEVFTYTSLDRLPSFPGGTAIMPYLRDNLLYPAEAKANGTQGRVKVSFIVEKDGSLTDLLLMEDIGDGCGQEALRLVKVMPKWVPGEKDNKVVRARQTLSIPFTIGH